MRYATTIRFDAASQKYGYAVTDGNGTKIAGMRGCATHGRAARLAAEKVRDLIRLDKSLGRVSWCEDT